MGMLAKSVTAFYAILSVKHVLLQQETAHHVPLLVTFTRTHVYQIVPLVCTIVPMVHVRHASHRV